MKKTLLFLIVLCLLVANATQVFANSDSPPTITVGSAFVKSGETAEIPVSIKNNPGVAGVELYLTYDAGIELVAVNQCKGQSNSALESLNFNVPGIISAVPLTLSLDGMVADNTNGDFLKLVFKVSENARPGILYNIKLSYKKGGIYDNDLNDLDFEIINGGILVLTDVGNTPFVEYEKSESGYVFDVDLTRYKTVDFEMANLVVALYDENQQLLKVAKADVLAGDLTKTIQVESSTATTAKIMLWDSATVLRPLYKAEHINILK